MQRVLSFPQMARNIGESSGEYVTKRLCFSFLISIGFLCLLCGFQLGRFITEKTMETQATRMRLELENALRNADHLRQLALGELERVSFERVADWERPELTEANLRYINGFFYNLSLVREVIERESCVRATVRGSREPDRYVVLSVSGDGVAVALELARVLDRLHSAHDWRPRRSLLFCASPLSANDCPRTILPDFVRRRVTAYVTIRGRFARVNGHVALSGSDVMRSVAVEAVETMAPGVDRTYLEHEVSGPRLPLDMPQVIFSFNDSNFARSQTHHNQSLLRDVTLVQMIGQTVWRLSESIVIQWEPKYFNETVNRILESIDSGKSRDAKEKLRKTLKVLLAAIKDLNVKIDATENIYGVTQMLRVRIWNDLLLDLDKALLCPDKNLTSKTDLATLRKLSSFESTDDALIYIYEMIKCYEDAIQILKER